jgi:Tfp pilus assembly protein PilO
MKVRQWLVIVLVIGLLVVYYLLWTDYRDQRQNNTALASQIAGATQQLALIPPATTDIEQRQAAASAARDSLLNSYPAQLNSTQIVNAILKLALDTGVKAVPMSTQPWAMESVNETSYPVFRLQLNIKGTYTQLADFLYRLENGEPGTLAFGNLMIERTGKVPLQGNETIDNIQVDANLDIAIYARPSLSGTSRKVSDK